MPYKCVHCSSVYADGSGEVLSGCTNCGGKFFFYLREDKMKEVLAQQNELDLDNQEKEQMEKDVREIAGVEDEDTPVFLDFESVKVLKPGKYLLDIGKLLSVQKPRVYQLEDGKYIIDIAHCMQKKEGENKNGDKKSVEKA